MPLLHTLVDATRDSVSMSALVAPSAAATVHASEEREPQQPEQDEQHEQEEEEAEDPEAPVRAVAVVVSRRHLRAGWHVRRDAIRPPDVVGDHAHDREQDDRDHQPDQTETASQVNLSS